MSPAALYALVVIGCGAIAALFVSQYLPSIIRRVLKAKPPAADTRPLQTNQTGFENIAVGWPKRNEGGGWEQRDGRITKDRDGLGPDLRERR